MYCVAKHCRSSYKVPSDIKFHRFPKDEERRRQWLSIVPLKGQLYNGSKICSLHFNAEDYDPDRPGHLTKYATPFYLVYGCQCCHATEDCGQQAVQNNCVHDSEENCPASSRDGSTSKHTDVLCSSPKADESDEDVESVYVLSEQFVEESVTSEGPVEKRRRIGHKTTQVKMKSLREVKLAKTIKILNQKVTRQQQKIEEMSSIIEVVRKYTHQSEIENILCGNFENLCSAVNRSKSKVRPTKYSEEVKTFASSLYLQSPSTYEYLRTIFSLPHKNTLERMNSMNDLNE